MFLQTFHVFSETLYVFPITLDLLLNVLETKTFIVSGNKLCALRLHSTILAAVCLCFECGGFFFRMMIL